eukprot:CAMPEP_0174827466 /NCGR_PEP_ID=MMETSP1114-20130205/736_1 /TAXON_ID=312471 /ORGANISM="Neobodo designis, Strain CCAP 1951/1" /LENGTH=291 /DNA_ID=CAMNT_0016061123 /DNA_START=169 /DNA_END=1044 /DNA_ORIENTATION=-
MSFNYPLLHFPACMIKDTAHQLVRYAQMLTSRRKPYPPMKHNPVRVFRTLEPVTEDVAFIAPNANLVGNIIMGSGSSAGFHTSIRAYHTTIATKVGSNTVLMDNSTLMGQVTIGNNCVIGQCSSLDTCTVHENVVIGTHCNVAIGAVIEQGSIIANGSTVARDTRVPANELWAGNPAEKVCDVTDEQRVSAISIHREATKQAQNLRVAIQEHYDEVPKEYSLEWLNEVCRKMDEQHMAVSFEEDIKVPIEGRRFLAPRVAARLPHMHAKVTYPVNRIAPHMPRLPDWTGNA